MEIKYEYLVLAITILAVCLYFYRETYYFVSHEYKKKFIVSGVFDKNSRQALENEMRKQGYTKVNWFTYYFMDGLS